MAAQCPTLMPLDCPLHGPLIEIKEMPRFREAMPLMQMTYRRVFAPRERGSNPWGSFADCGLKSGPNEASSLFFSRYKVIGLTSEY